MGFKEDTETLLFWATNPTVSAKWQPFIEQSIRLWHEIATCKARHSVTAWRCAVRTLPGYESASLPQPAIEAMVHQLKQAHWDKHGMTVGSLVGAVIEYSNTYGSKFVDLQPLLYATLHTSLSAPPHPKAINWNGILATLIDGAQVHARMEQYLNGADYASLYPSEMSSLRSIIPCTPEEIEAQRCANKRALRQVVRRKQEARRKHKRG